MRCVLTDDAISVAATSIRIVDSIEKKIFVEVKKKTKKLASYCYYGDCLVRKLEDFNFVDYGRAFLLNCGYMKLVQ